MQLIQTLQFDAQGIDEMNLGSENQTINTVEEQETKRIKKGVTPVCQSNLSHQETFRSPLQGHHSPGLGRKKGLLPTLASLLPMY